MRPGSPNTIGPLSLDSLATAALIAIRHSYPVYLLGNRSTRHRESHCHQGHSPTQVSLPSGTLARYRPTWQQSNQLSADLLSSSPQPQHSFTPAQREFPLTLYPPNTSLQPSSGFPIRTAWESGSHRSLIYRSQLPWTSDFLPTGDALTWGLSARELLVPIGSPVAHEPSDPIRLTCAHWHLACYLRALFSCFKTNRMRAGSSFAH